MPTPHQSESREDFVSRCIPQLIKTEGRSADQAAAICYSLYQNKDKEMDPVYCPICDHKMDVLCHCEECSKVNVYSEPKSIVIDDNEDPKINQDDENYPDEPQEEDTNGEMCYILEVSKAQYEAIKAMVTLGEIKVTQKTSPSPDKINESQNPPSANNPNTSNVPEEAPQRTLMVQAETIVQPGAEIGSGEVQNY